MTLAARDGARTSLTPFAMEHAAPSAARSLQLQLVLVVHGRGRGHAVRARAILEALRAEGHTVRLLAGGAARDVLRDDAALETIESVAPGPRLVRRMAARVRDDRLRFQADRPDVVITDGDAPSSLAAASLGIPVVSVGHGLVFAHCDTGPLPFALRTREALNAASSSLFADARVAVHFGSARPLGPKTRVARADVRSSLDRRRPTCGHVVAYFRDEGGDAWLEAIARAGIPVLLFSRRTLAPRGVTLNAPDLDAFAAALGTASGALGTAGSNLVAECAFLGIPLLALPAADDVEQRLNARVVETSGLGVAGILDRFDARTAARFAHDVGRVGWAGRRPDALPRTPGAAASVLAAVHDVHRRRTANGARSR